MFTRRTGLQEGAAGGFRPVSGYWKPATFGSPERFTNNWPLLWNIRGKYKNAKHEMMTNGVPQLHLSRVT